MKQNLSEKTINEIDFQCDWMAEIIKFTIEMGESGYREVLDNVEVIRKMQKLSIVKHNYNEINSMAIEETEPTLLPELNRRLKAKFGKTLWDVNKKMETKINSIAKRGTLRNDEEFYLTRNYIDTIADVAEKETLCAVLEKITDEYEMAKS